MRDHYQLAIIGSGSGGSEAVSLAARNGFGEFAFHDDSALRPISRAILEKNGNCSISVLETLIEPEETDHLEKERTCHA